jgi:hypothetical protein
MILDDSFIQGGIGFMSAYGAGNFRFATYSKHHSLRHTGEYPEMPIFLFSHRFAYTSFRPLNRDKGSATRGIQYLSNFGTLL